MGVADISKGVWSGHIQCSASGRDHHKETQKGSTSLLSDQKDLRLRLGKSVTCV